MEGFSGVVRTTRSHVSLSALRRGAGWLARGLDRLTGILPPTAAGLLLAGLSLLAFFSQARSHLDLVLLVASLLGMGLCAMSWLAVSCLAVVTRRRWARPAPQGEPARLEAGLPHVTSFLGPTSGWLPLLRIRWEWVWPPGVTVTLLPEGSSQREQVVFAGRMLVDRVARNIVVEDVLGLAAIRWTRVEPAALRVLPRTSRSPLAFAQGPVAGDGVAWPGGRPEGDRVELRGYAPGDPLRLLLWKVFARTRQLVVRAPEQAVLPAQRTMAYLVAGDGDEAAAAAARMALEAGLLGSDWSFAADGTDQPTSELEEALLAVARSATARHRHGEALGRYLSTAPARGAARLVVFAPAHPQPWLDHVLAALQAHPLPVLIVLGVEELSTEEQPAPGRLQRLLLRPGRPRPAVPTRLLAPLHTTLAAAGVDWALLERSTGRTYLASQLAAARSKG